MKAVATMADVAMRAGVSVSTVSHVVNETRRVNAETTERVNKVIQELGYVPNRVARSLVTSDTQLIGIVMSALTNRMLPNTFPSLTHDRLVATTGCTPRPCLRRTAPWSTVARRFGPSGTVLAIRQARKD